MALPSVPFNAANTIFAGLSILLLKLDAQLTGVTAATTVVTKTAHGLLVGDTVEYVSGTGFTGLTAGDLYHVLTVPSADTFTIGSTADGSAIAVGTSSAGVFAPVFACAGKKLDSALEQESKTLEVPDDEGVLREVRRVTVKQKESFTFGFTEVKRLLRIFSNGLAGRRSGTATIFLPDPDDVAGKCALKSEKDFACVVEREGNLSFGTGEFPEATIRLDSQKRGVITWTADATV